MFRILFPEDTTYITNKAINGKRVEDANVSAASTIDLFKLYEESSLKNTGSAGVVELSRALLKFATIEEMLRFIQFLDSSFAALWDSIRDVWSQVWWIALPLIAFFIFWEFWEL